MIDDEVAISATRIEVNLEGESIALKKDGYKLALRTKSKLDSLVK